MKRNEARYRVTALLLGADKPRTLGEVVEASGVPRPAAIGALERLADEGAVLEGELAPGQPGPQYFWTARWAGREREGRRGRRSASPGPQDVAIDSATVLAFNEFVLRGYTPPADKRWLVFFQDSVRRPFSKSGSHAFMRRAVSVATGHDPAREFDACPVHVVVLASRIGPVPYELEEFYPADVRGGGVKHFGDDHYFRIRPILAARMAEYITAHGRHYEQMATFTDSRYGDVMREAAKLAGVELPIFPQRGGPRVLSLGESEPRTYWQKFWIQLCLEIVAWLPSAERCAAEQRLRKLKVRYA